MRLYRVGNTPLEGGAQPGSLVALDDELGAKLVAKGRVELVEEADVVAEPEVENPWVRVRFEDEAQDG